MDYKNILMATDKAMENGFTLTEEQGVVALDAITGYLNHMVLGYAKHGLKELHWDLTTDMPNKAEVIYDRFERALVTIKETCAGFQALASLGYKPSHDKLELMKAEEWDIMYRIFDETDDIPGALISLYVEFERSAFLPCEL